MIRVVAIFVLFASSVLPSYGAEPAEKQTVVITGANRGIGLAYAKQFADKGYAVIGTARDPESATELKATGARVVALDVTDAASVAALAKQLQGVAIDILVNNAGVFDRSDSTIDKVDFETLEQTFAVNAFGPLRVTQALLPNLRAGKGKRIINMSSQLGSIQNSSGRWYGYRASKSALNQFSKILGTELGGEGFVVVALHPGWVQTQLGGMNATYTPEESARGLIEVIEGLDADDNGTFGDFRGEPLPW